MKFIHIISVIFLLVHAQLACSQCTNCYTGIVISNRCNGEATVLKANTNGNLVEWSTDGGDPSTILATKGFSTSVYPSVKTRYVANTIHLDSNLIVNGSFDSTVTTFYTEYSEGDPGSFGTGEYTITDKPNDLLSAFLPVTEHTGNGGYMLLVDGSEELTPFVVWRDSVNVQSGKDYRISLAAANIHENFAGSGDKSSYNNPEIAVYINGQLQEQWVLPDNPDWKEFSFLWTAVTSEKIDITIRDLDTNVKENDFVIDDLKFQEAHYSSAYIDVEPCEDVEVFSPDGDGKYDAYQIDGNGKAKIFNSEGTFINEIDLPGNWDGKDKNGNFVSTGYYAIIINDSKVIHVSIIK